MCDLTDFRKIIFSITFSLNLDIYNFFYFNQYEKWLGKVFGYVIDIFLIRENTYL